MKNGDRRSGNEVGGDAEGLPFAASLVALCLHVVPIPPLYRVECRRHDRCRGLAAKALVSIKLVPSSHISLIYFMLPRRRMHHFDSAHAEFCQWWSEMEDSAMTDVAYVTFVCEHRCSKGSIALRSHYQLVHQFFTEHRSSSKMPFFLGTLFCHEGSA